MGVASWRDHQAVILAAQQWLTDPRRVAAPRSDDDETAAAAELTTALTWSATVRKHVTHVLGTLGAASRTEAVARAGGFGLAS